jgi:hypothetical protein
MRSNSFSDATRATAGSTRGITCGFRITKARCRSRRKIKRSRLHGRSALPRGALERGRRVGPTPIASTHDEAALTILQRRSTLRSRNHLDQNYKLSLHHLIIDGGVGAQQSEAESAVEHEQALDGWFLAVTIAGSARQRPSVLTYRRSVPSGSSCNPEQDTRQNTRASGIGGLRRARRGD